MNQFKLEHFEPLKTIRNNAIAHRDLDSITQLTSIINISWSDTIEIVNKFDNILNRLGSVMQQIINIGLVNFEELKDKNKYNQKIENYDSFYYYRNYCDYWNRCFRFYGKCKTERV